MIWDIVINANTMVMCHQRTAWRFLVFGRTASTSTAMASVKASGPPVDGGVINRWQHSIVQNGGKSTWLVTMWDLKDGVTIKTVLVGKLLLTNTGLFFCLRLNILSFIVTTNLGDRTGCTDCTAVLWGTAARAVRWCTGYWATCLIWEPWNIKMVELLMLVLPVTLL